MALCLTVRITWALVFELVVVLDASFAESERVPIQFHVPLTMLPPARMASLSSVDDRAESAPSTTATPGQLKMSTYPVARLSHGRAWSASNLKRSVKL